MRGKNDVRLHLNSRFACEKTTFKVKRKAAFWEKVVLNERRVTWAQPVDRPAGRAELSSGFQRKDQQGHRGGCPHTLAGAGATQGTSFPPTDPGMDVISH